MKKALRILGHDALAICALALGLPKSLPPTYLR
jgi:hypothetical protein